MYCNRHCTKEDYYRIKEMCDNFLCKVKNDCCDYLDYGKKLQLEMKNYDEDLSNSFSRVICRYFPSDELYQKSKEIIDELLSNVLIDVYEHNEK